MPADRDAANAFSLTALKPSPRRQHQPFLRAANGHIDTPFVVAVVDRCERGDGVDQQQRRVACGIKGGA